MKIQNFRKCNFVQNLPFFFFSLFDKSIEDILGKPYTKFQAIILKLSPPKAVTKSGLGIFQENSENPQNPRFDLYS